MTQKNDESSRPRRFFASEKLLNRDYALHAEREVRGAVNGILPRLDIPKGNRDGLSRIYLKGAGELSHLLGTHVCIELGPGIGRDRCRIKGDVVRAAAHDYELGAVACLNGEIRWLEAVTLRVADHLHFVNSARYRGRSDCP